MVQELGLLDGGRVLGPKSYDFWAEIVHIMGWIVILAGKMLILNNDFPWLRGHMNMNFSLTHKKH